MWSSFAGVSKFGRRPASNTSSVTSGLTLRLSASEYPGTGTTWSDISGNGADLTLENSPTYTAGPPSYFTFASASSQSAAGVTTNVIPANAYTKSIWFYLNSYADNNLISSATGGHFLFTANTSTLYAGHANVMPYNGFGSVTTLSLNTWYYAAVTFSTSAGIKLYINGVLDASNAGFTTAHAGNGSVNIGRFGAGNYLDGRVGDVFCYDRALTDSEILQNFNATKAAYGL